MNLHEVLESFVPANAIRVRAMREYCLVEGTAESLRFLASLLNAVADSESCDFDCSPFGAGSALLTQDSTRGLLIHRLPCEHGAMDVRRPRVESAASGPPVPAKLGDISGGRSPIGPTRWT